MLPVWLVDVEVKASWKAEVGFNYQVVSHQEKYEQNKGVWSTREVHETRTRWEPRLGSLLRRYNNLPAPATEDHMAMMGEIGEFDFNNSLPFSADTIQSAWMRLPDRSNRAAWSDAEPALKSAAAEECRQAANADFLREFSWQTEVRNQNWTLLLLPALSSFYLDDEGKRQPIFINGQTGKIAGMRKASPKRARQTALIMLGISAVLFLLSVGLLLAGVVFPGAIGVGIVGGLVALLISASAMIPIAIVWGFNRKQDAHSQIGERN